MATLNYTQRLANQHFRRTDPSEVKASQLSDSYAEFSASRPSNLKYLTDSMKPIESKYNDKTIQAARYVQNYLTRDNNLNISTVFKTQGSVMTNTNIKVHSDFDLLNVINDYHFCAPEIPINIPYTDSIPHEDIAKLRKQASRILKEIYDEVNDTNEKCLSIYNKSLHRKVDIVFCFWYHTAEYIKTGKEYYRGIQFPSGSKLVDFPFAHIEQVNLKGQNTYDGSRKGIRLLKNLREDSEVPLKVLKSFHLTSIVHSIPDNHLFYSDEHEIYIAHAISDAMSEILRNPIHRRSITSPNGTETPFENDELLPEIKRLKDDLDTLIKDTSEELSSM